MLLIIFLGLFATLTSVSGDCVVGKQDVDVVNFTKALGTWYVLLHTPNDFESNFECVVVKYALSEENVILITLEAYDISANSIVVMHGNATNLTNNSLDEFFQEPTIWNGRYYIVAIEYDRYVILKMCSFETNQLYVYVAYRSNRPDKATLNRVKKELRKSNIDITQLVNWPADNCQQA